MAERENGSSPRLPRRWPGSVTGGRYWWSRRCWAGRSGSMTCPARSRIAANILSERLKRLELGPRASPALMIEARSASVYT
jgi:hypothetical protein